MATKAELEAELLKLKRQLADHKDPQPKDPPAINENAPVEETPDAVVGEKFDWDKEVTEVLASLEEFPNKKPLLLAAGAFALGLLIGRSR